MRQQKSQKLELAFWVVGRNRDLGSTVYKEVITKPGHLLP